VRENQGVLAMRFQPHTSAKLFSFSFMITSDFPVEGPDLDLLSVCLGQWRFQVQHKPADIWGVATAPEKRHLHGQGVQRMLVFVANKGGTGGMVG